MSDYQKDSHSRELNSIEIPTELIVPLTSHKRGHNGHAVHHNARSVLCIVQATQTVTAYTVMIRYKYSTCKSKRKYRLEPQEPLLSDHMAMHGVRVCPATSTMYTASDKNC
eukprot:1190886-Prorocentrum_minimum.AAC.1